MGPMSAEASRRTIPSSANPSRTAHGTQHRMPTLDLHFVPASSDLDVAIVVDALRMTTTCTAMLGHGASEIVVVADAAAARFVAASSDALLFGERGGLPLKGFDGGNSPLELDPDLLRGRCVVVCTSNGSKAVEAAAGARHMLLGAAPNARAAATRALELARTSVTVVCAGTDGMPSLDDVVVGGCILRELVGLEPAAATTDTAQIAMAVAAPGGELRDWLARSAHGRTLLARGFEADLAYAANLSTVSVVGERRFGRPPSFTARS
jgi:2-phosphosulfolactate phosphatase